MNVCIETERLLIRPLQLADYEGMFVMDSDPEVHKYVGKNPVQTKEHIKEVISFVRQQYKDHGIGRWAVIEKASNEFAGWVGFKYMAGPINQHSNFYDFGYRFARRFWGMGYASEAGRAALNHGIESLGFKDIYAMTDIDNGASRRVLEKLGFKYIETFDYDAEPGWRTEGQPTTWYKWMG